MNNPNARVSSQLASYMHYVSEEGINLDRFVEQGGRLLGREEAAGLSGDLAKLPDAAETGRLHASRDSIHHEKQAAQHR